MYKDLLLDHYRNPRNAGKIKKKTHSAVVYNPTCGDMIELDLVIKDGRVEAIAHTGEGCAISTASASILSEYVKGKKIDELINIDRKAMIKIVGIEVTPGRIKCLLLSLEALQKALLKK